MQRYVDVIRDDTGAAVEGAEVRVYQGDTTTLATVYDGAENVVAQPLSTNSSGVIINGATDDDDKIGFKAAAGRYRIEVSKGTASFTLRDVLLGTLSGVDEEDLGTAASRDVGTDPHQVPTNADLGSAAYEDADAFSSRIASPTPGNLVQQTADGDLEDAGIAFSDFYEETVLPLDGDFASGELRIARLGNVVTVSMSPTTTFNAHSNPTTTAGFLPSRIRPAYLVRTAISSAMVASIDPGGAFSLAAPAAINYAEGTSLSYVTDCGWPC